MSKRKWEAFDDSDDEEPLLGRQILPVANLPEDFNGIPADGMQYLFTVRRDARHLPLITRVANPYELPERPPTSNSGISKHPALPSDEWRALFEKRFKNLRKNMTLAALNVDSSRDVPHKLMPDKRERDRWWAFIAGKPEVDWNPPTVPKQRTTPQSRRRIGQGYGQGLRGFSDDLNYDTTGTQIPQETWHINDEGEVELALRVDPTESLPTPSGSPMPSSLADSGQLGQPICQQAPGVLQDSEGCKPREPTPTLMKLIDHRMSLHLLMYFTHWINVHTQKPELPSLLVTDTHARWIFALLSRVDDNVSADEMNLLRNLARAALTLLKQLIQQRSTSAGVEFITDAGVILTIIPMDEISCWLVVSVVVGVWGQRDIWMDAEAMLVSLDAEQTL